MRIDPDIWVYFTDSRRTCQGKIESFQILFWPLHVALIDHNDILLKRYDSQFRASLET